MRRAMAYSNYCSQVVQIYLHPFHRNSLFTWSEKCQRITKTPYFGVQGRSKSSML